VSEDSQLYLPAHGWEPRDDQVLLWDYLENGGLRAVEVCHRRWGKDEVGLNFTATASQQRIGNYWHMLPQFAQCRKAIWEAVNPRTGRKRIDDVFPMEMRKATRNTDMYIEFTNGASWQLVGSDNYNSLVGSPPVGLVLSEYALADPQCWAYLSPILEENGGWALFISTSRGNNHLKRILDYAKVHAGWHAEVLPASKTPVFTREKLLEVKAGLVGAFGLELGEAMYEQEYECSFQGAVIGSYYGKQMALARKDQRITRVPHETGLEVYTFWDLGVDDSMTIWFMQFVGRETRVIDYCENSGMGLAYYAKALKGEIEGTEHRKQYTYGDHYMPHDAAVREMSAGEHALSRVEVAEGLGIKPVVIVTRPRNTDAVMNGIEAGRNILGTCYFDEEKCQVGISALEGYRSEYDEVKKVMKNTPLHDWCSHGADAFRTFAVGYKPKAKKGGGSGRRRISGWAV
jgi:phage terminase large subunit